MTITLRGTKGSRLTHAELDANFTSFQASDGSSNVGFIQSGTGAVARTVQAKERDWVSVLDFGAVGDGSTDDTTAFNNAIAALPSIGGTLVFPAPSVGYRLTSSITLAARSRLKVVGTAPSGGLKGCSLIWDGANGGTVLILDRVRDSLFEDFSITAGTGTIGVGIQVDNVNAPSGSTNSTNNIFKRIAIGAATAGVQIGNTSTANNDLHTFEDCTLDGASTYGYYINDGQSKWIKIVRGSIASKTNGIYLVAGSFNVHGTNFSGNTTDVRLGATTDAINIVAAQSESANKFLDDTGVAGSAWAVSIIGSRLTMNNVGGDNIYIRYRRRGTLTLVGNDFAGGNAIASVQVSANVSAPGANLVSMGNVYPNSTPFATASGEIVFICSLGDTYITGGSGTPLPGVMQGYGGAAAGRVVNGSRKTPTYGASVAIDALTGHLFVITATDGVAFTVTNPTNAVTGQEIRIRIKNTSGGALGVATWDTLYKLGAAWTQPATGFSRAIDFEYDGTNWVEANRSAADVAN